MPDAPVQDVIAARGRGGPPRFAPESEGFMRPLIVGILVGSALVAADARSESPRDAQSPSQNAAAAQITVLSSNGFQAVMEDLAPRFERAKHMKLAVTYDLAATIKKNIESGRAFDLAILTPAAIDDLIASGRVAPASRTTLARSGLGFAVRAGARKPNVATSDAFKRTLADAKSIAYVKEGASGVAFAALVKRIGIADALEPKTRLKATRDEVGEAKPSAAARWSSACCRSARSCRCPASSSAPRFQASFRRISSWSRASARRRLAPARSAS